MIVIGISAYYHDSAVALVIDGRVTFAASEERFTRIKHEPRFPAKALQQLLSYSNLQLEDVDYVVFYEKPFLKFERIVESYLHTSPRGFRSFLRAGREWLGKKLFLKAEILRELKQLTSDFSDDKLLFSEHHLSHAASAYYPSSFSHSAVITMDGVGEWATTTIGIGHRLELDLLRTINYPHSIGLLYSAFTYYLGFKVNGGEYKVMGLAPYGTAKYVNLILDNLIDIKEDGSFRLNQSYFNYMSGLTMTNHNFNALFGQPERSPEHPLQQFHADVAASLQLIVTNIVLRISRFTRSLTNSNNLCLAGGVALNCVTNGKLKEADIFDNIWIQPAAGDAGGAIGAALYCFFQKAPDAGAAFSLRATAEHTFLGTEYSDSEVESLFTKLGIEYSKMEESKLVNCCAELLSEDKCIGWFQGRMEFGPRALGNRSILADPRNASTQKKLNIKIKNRESFRPFAPAVLAEKAPEWFEFEGESPFMLYVAAVHKCKLKTLDVAESRGLGSLGLERSAIAAVTHVDNSARLQTVAEKTNPRFYALIKAFEAKTGCPVLVNTSFNVRGEPIVESPINAIQCFFSTEMDYLVINNFIVDKSSQNSTIIKANSFDITQLND